MKGCGESSLPKFKELEDFLLNSPLKHTFKSKNDNELQVSFFIRARPGSKLSKVSFGPAGELLVWVRARAVEGAANEAIRDVLASYLGVSASLISLEKGALGRSKQFTVCFRRKDNKSVAHYVSRLTQIVESA